MTRTGTEHYTRRAEFGKKIVLPPPEDPSSLRSKRWRRTGPTLEAGPFFQRRTCPSCAVCVEARADQGARFARGRCFQGACPTPRATEDPQRQDQPSSDCEHGSRDARQVGKVDQSARDPCRVPDRKAREKRTRRSLEAPRPTQEGGGHLARARNDKDRENPRSFRRQPRQA